MSGGTCPVCSEGVFRRNNGQGLIVYSCGHEALESLVKLADGTAPGTERIDPEGSPIAHATERPGDTVRRVARAICDEVSHGGGADDGEIVLTADGEAIDLERLARGARHGARLSLGLNPDDELGDMFDRGSPSAAPGSIGSGTNMIPDADVTPVGDPAHMWGFQLGPQTWGEPGDRYTELRRILEESILDAAEGKGQERHDPLEQRFEDQKIVQVAEWQGSTFGPIYQAVKKSIESCGMDDDRARRELLGAINYLAAAVLIIDRRNEKGPTP